MGVVHDYVYFSLCCCMTLYKTSDTGTDDDMTGHYFCGFAAAFIERTCM
jgi:hypothetical protein